jgi:hypothetical protein
MLDRLNRELHRQCDPNPDRGWPTRPYGEAAHCRYIDQLTPEERDVHEHPPDLYEGQTGIANPLARVEVQRLRTYVGIAETIKNDIFISFMAHNDGLLGEWRGLNRLVKATPASEPLPPKAVDFMRKLHRQMHHQCPDRSI